MSTTDLPGSSLLANRYRLVERLGAGGMSVVWRGFDEVLGRQVAVKVLPPSTSADPSFRRRLRAEAQAAARLSHPHITNVYDYGEATTVDGEPVPYVVMELVDGESLAAVLARTRRLPWPAAVRICAEVSAALAAAHARGIVHRDVTPANVMLTPTGAKVVDFGISALIGENDIDPDGSLLGTPAYLAPERLEGGQVSPATDVYAVGLLVYRTLIGQLPWDVGTTTALLRAHQYTEPEPLPPVEGLPQVVADMVEQCLEKRPSDRPTTAHLAEVLSSVSAGAPAARGYVPDWAESSGEDTTILPHALPQTDGIGRVRPGHARVADGPAQAGRGVAAVPAASAASASENAPVSPAPGSAVPVPLADVQAAVAGQPVAGRMPAAGPNQVDMTGSVGPGRNNRFAGEPLPGTGVPAGPDMSMPEKPVSPAPGLRHSHGGGGNKPPNSPGSAGSTGPSRGRPQNRRIMVAALGVLLLGATAYGWSLVAGPSNGGPDRANAAPTVLPDSQKCVVSYAVYSDDGDRFKASVTVANREKTAIKNWNLWFIMQGDQVVSGGGRGTAYNLEQADKAVTVKSTAALGGQKTATIEINGRYAVSNTAPMVFQLGGETCETYVSDKPGAPSRPVQRLSNGEVRLGPPTTTPRPGLSLSPGGVVIIDTSKDPGPTTGGPTTGPTTTAPTTAPPTTQAPVDCNAVPRPPIEICPVVPGPTDKTSVPAPTTEVPTPPPTFVQPEDPDEPTGGDDEGPIGPPPGP